jgi:hypothetical protein
MTFGISTFLDDRNLLGKDFAAPSWWHWKLVLRAALGERLRSDEVEVFREISGGRDPPQRRVRELWLAIGRRAGKDSIASALATYLAIYGDFKKHLRRGEKAVILCLAVDRTQAEIVFDYIRGYLEEIPLLRVMLVSASNGVIELTNGVKIVVVTNSFRAIRGRTVACAILDEIAFWRDERYANPDTEVYSALMPSLISLRQSGSMLVGISTVYRRAGLLYEKFASHHGKSDDDVLFIRAPAVTFNPLLLQPEAQAEIERLRADDPSRAAAEWDSEWRTDIERFVSREMVEAAVISRRHEVEPVPRVNYAAFVDPSGGSGEDSMTLSIVHRDRTGVVVLDLIRERKPIFSPEDVVGEFCDVLKTYRVRRVTGDRYAGEWPREQFRKRGVDYSISDKSKSEIYVEFLPILNSGKIELLDHSRLIQQLCSLERRTGRGTGRDSIDHPPRGHDDIINAVAGAAVYAASGPRPVNITPEMMAWANAQTGRSWDSPSGRVGCFAGDGWVRH